MRSVTWENGQVMLIDQRRLPGEFVVAGFGTVDDVAAAIRDMVVRGVPAIGATGAYAMALAAYASPAADRAQPARRPARWPRPRSTLRGPPPST